MGTLAALAPNTARNIINVHNSILIFCYIYTFHYFIFFVYQYSLGVKRDEMRKLEEIAAAEERKLELAEQYLEEDAAMFDEFLKENDKNSVEAIKA